MQILNNPVFFIATTRAAESRHFYESILKLTCKSDDPFALVFEIGVSTLRIQKVEEIPKLNFTVLGWEVKDIRHTVETLTASGVVFEKFSQLPQDESGIWNSPSGASIAWFKDPDGNTLSLTEP